MSLNREFLIWKERGRVREREGWAGGRVGEQVSWQAYLRFWRDREKRERYREIERHRNQET
jgi:hypothetical protein